MQLSSGNRINNNSGRSRSLWMEIQLAEFSTLEQNISAEVCIIGSGIVGLTCAYELCKRGKSVIVLDQGAIAGGQTARTTAHLSWVLDDRFYHLDSLFGPQDTRVAAQSHAAAIDYIETLIQKEEIICDFARVDGYLFASPDSQEGILEKEFIAIQKIGMEVDKITRAPFYSSFSQSPCLRFPRQGQFHIMKYIQGLIQAILSLGGKIYSNVHADSFEDGSPCCVKTSTAVEITAQHVIVATCTPVNNRFFIHTKQSAYRTYAIAGKILKGSVQKALYWDTAEPYHYVRVQPCDANHDWLIIGGEDHKTGQEKECQLKYKALETWAATYFPMLKQIAYHWSGQVFEPVDSLAFIGRNPGDQHIYIATGDSGNGITHGTIAGMLLPDLIEGLDHPWKKIYDPSRKTFKAAAEFFQENLNVARQYLDWLTPSEVQTLSMLPADEGIILREGLKKIAVYKDKQNHMHVHSAFCPHLGGCVRWNESEKSWDCPCHGSRFDGYGQILNGPAVSDLTSISKSELLP